MKEYWRKFKHLVPTFLLICFATTILVLSFRWVFTIQFQVFTIKEDYFNLWIPIILPLIPIYFWLNPKLQIVTTKQNGSASVFLWMITWITSFFMIMLSNNYLINSTGKYIEIFSVENLEDTEVRFLSLKEINLKMDFISAHTEFRTSGRSNTELNFDTYFVVPFSRQNSNNKFKYWYGIKFYKNISNRLEPEEKDKIYQSFMKQSYDEVLNYDFTKADYFEILPHSKDRDGFLDAVYRNDDIADANPIIIEPKKGLYSEINGDTFAWIFGAFFIGLALFLMLLIFPDFNSSEYKRQSKGIIPKNEEVRDILSFLIPRDWHFATSILLNLNILVLLVMVFSGISLISPKGLELLKWGANRRSETLGGDWWRLVTSMFLHGGIMHLMLNCVGLVFAALFIEPQLGRIRFLILYFISGICGSLASIYWYENTISVGASGAIFGLYGAVLALSLTNAFKNEYSKRTFLFFALFVGVNLFFGFVSVGIDNAAHVGGLISGSLMGIILYFTMKKQTASKTNPYRYE